jgi:hypothetical protein
MPWTTAQQNRFVSLQPLAGFPCIKFSTTQFGQPLNVAFKLKLTRSGSSAPALLFKILSDSVESVCHLDELDMASLLGQQGGIMALNL